MVTDRDKMESYWNSAGASPKANWHIIHIDDEEEFFASGPRDVQKVFDNRADEIAPGSLILDVGCGKGRIARALAEMRPDVRIWGVDVAPSMIKGAMAANAHLINLSFCIGDGVSFSIFPDDTFDYVYSYIVFQHLPRHIAAQNIAEAARVLKPGGKLIFQVQRQGVPMEVDPPWNDFRKIRYYTEKQAVALIAPPLKLLRTRSRAHRAADLREGTDHDFFVEAVKLGAAESQPDG